MFRKNIKIYVPAWGAFLFLALAVWSTTGQAAAAGGERQHLVYWAGTPQQLDVYKIYGRQPGRTVMIIGGIQGDEAGGFMSADLYADLALKRGNLIVVPRANFKSIIQFHRGPDGDMNRKFRGDLSRDPDRNIVEILKELMAESDLVLNLHDGSGFYRPAQEKGNKLTGPNFYGQCIIADADVFTHPTTGRLVRLGDDAREVARRVNEEIEEPLYKFHFFNTRTDEPDSRHKEQRGSVTYYAITQLGIPAYGVETSKQLPSLEMKIHQHNLAINAFLDLYGLEVEQPGLRLEPPTLGYVVISVNKELPLAVADGQTLEVARGSTIEVIDVVSNYDRGLSADVLGLGSFNDLRTPLEIQNPTAIVIQKDQVRIGRINLGILPAGQTAQFPRLTGPGQARSPRGGLQVAAAPPQPKAPGPAADPDTDRQARAVIIPPTAGAGDDTDPSVTKTIEFNLPEEREPAPAPPDRVKPDQVEPEEIELRPGPGRVTGFRLEVDGRTVEVAPGQTLEVASGALVKMVDLISDGTLPADLVMNLRGFVPKSKQYQNDGQDKGFTADTGRDMKPAFSVGQKGQIYALNAEIGQEIVASAALKLVQPRLDSVTLELDGQSRSLKAWGRLGVPAGSQFVVTGVELAGGLPLSNPRFTLGGQPFPAELPQTLTMPSFNANLAVFNGETLTGKVTLVAK